MKTNHFLLNAAIFCTQLAVVPASQAIGVGSVQQPVQQLPQIVDQRTEPLLDSHLPEASERRSSVTIPVLDIRARDAFSHLPLMLPERIQIPALDGSPALIDVRVENGWRAVEQQWLVVITAAEIALLEEPGIEIIDQTSLNELDMLVVRFRVTSTLDSREALERIMPASVIDSLDRNHIYAPQSDNQVDGGIRASEFAMPFICNKPVTIGMVDTAIELDHPSLRQTTVTQKHFLPGMKQATKHGTAVASVLAGRRPDNGIAKLPQANLFNASVFFDRDGLSEGATLLHLLEGLEWLLAQKVAVINISMAGPENRLLEAVTRRIAESGTALVAAVGNAGPAAQPLYPAAYPHVVGVTAVDEFREVYRWANQGPQVEFAALGVNVLLAHAGQAFEEQSGTSLAAPLVTGYVACAMESTGLSTDAVLDRMAEQAIDLGDPGRDPTFGHGLLGEN
ncbi:S8 family serine peptidase [Halopseudomonas sp.]|uniref:S8 family serine peptidase n=1 Tax=Halopseudomonas sp. TaxID=2901191 RepID=UPI0035641989